MEIFKKARRDILKSLGKAIRAIKKENVVKLKGISNSTIHCASIFQDEYSISFAVVIYALSRILQEEKYKRDEKWNVIKNSIVQELQNALDSLTKENLEGYQKAINNIIIDIKKLEDKFSTYLDEIIKRAKIKKGSRIFEHGISSAMAAQILGISNWELRDYIGKTKIADIKTTKSPKQRLELLRSIFNEK